jgi:tetratricopeptide (TPR) repeat protein
VASEPPSPAHPSPPPAPVHKLKIGAIKFGPFDIGPFELESSARFRMAWAGFGLAVVLAVSVAVVYGLLVKPPLDEALGLMRRAEYISAAKALEALPPWAQALPGAKALTAQAAFGSQLARGEHIATLAAALDDLARRYPQEPDVLVFQGLKAYYADAKVMPAIQLFTQAADLDKAHVEAHFLAAGRHVERAYLALAAADAAQARAAAVEARRLIDRAVEGSPFANVLPQYASQIAELDELEGDSQQAHAVYARLAPQHAWSAVQAAMLSWQMPAAAPALRNGLEGIESAIQRIEKDPGDGAVEGWTFRVSASESIAVHPKNEKLCLLEWVQAISRVLLLTQSSGTATAKPTPKAAPARCGSGAIAQRIADVVCVAATTAQDRLPPADRRRAVLKDWRAQQLSCAAGVQALPVLPPSAGTAKLTAWHITSRSES